MLLSFFNSITGSYALALLFYALVFKLLFLPFGIKQQKNQIKMAKLTPKIELIKAKYRGRTDQRTMQKQQEEIMALQQKEGYSPLSGCLPLLLQLPLIMLIYAVIRSPISYIATTEATPVERYNQIVSDGKVDDGELAEYNELCDKLEYYYPSRVSEKKEITKDDIVRKAYAEFVGDPAELKTDKLDQIQIVNQIKAQLKTDSLAAEKLEKLGINEGSIPDFELFGVNLADKPSFTNISLLVLIPILAAAFTYLSMLITKKLNANPAQTQVQQDAQTAASMKIMDLVMPLMTLWIAFSFSGMLGLYWIYQSILGVVQTVILAKAMPMPKYTEEELKAMKKAQKAAEKAQRAALKENPKVRSLHNIDEDDYESLPEISTDEKAKEKKSQGIDITDIKD
jgi:YidC/Oxa1 family membrane protein insertase